MQNYIENDLMGNENCFKLAGGSSYRRFELPGVDCILMMAMMTRMMMVVVVVVVVVIMIVVVMMRSPH